MKNKRKIVMTSLLVIALLLVTIGVSFAFFNYVGTGQETSTVETGTLSFVYDEDLPSGNSIALTNALPMSDTEGKALTGASGVFDFQIRATTTGVPIYYEIMLEKNDASTLDENVVKVYLTEVGETETEVIDPINNQAINTYDKLGETSIEGMKGKTLYQGTINPTVHNLTKDYRLRMWLSEDANTVEDGEWIYGGKTFTAKVNVYASNDILPLPEASYTPYVDKDTSGAIEPNLIEGLIPVVWNEKEQQWIKADTSLGWYNYDKQMWANAVTVTSASRSEYNSAAANTIISMDDIETMWVWIPRYSYTIGNTYGVQGYGGDTPSVSTPGAIDIKFIDVDTKETGSATYSGSSPENWRTPDGFTFGSQELPGIWVAKFETSSTTTTPDADDGGGNTTSYDPLVKPDVISWRKINVSNAFTVSQKLTAEGNRYGLDTNADGHMMKNSEWGLVAYLSQSKYGKYGNTDYTGTNKEVYKNNSSSYYTGRSKGSAPATSSDYTSAGSYTYAIEENGTGASTTGTIYGVYDMSGGAWEYTMSNYNGTIKNAGFSSLPDSKYYDKYTSTTISSACNGGTCYGHALSETSGWYSDTYNMVNSSYPWAQRGGRYVGSSSSGVFYFAYYNGGTNSGSFRLVLAPGA